jgi:hypothetical protein
MQRAAIAQGHIQRDRIAVELETLANMATDVALQGRSIAGQFCGGGFAFQDCQEDALANVLTARNAARHQGIDRDQVRIAGGVTGHERIGEQRPFRGIRRREFLCLPLEFTPRLNVFDVLGDIYDVAFLPLPAS